MATLKEKIRWYFLNINDKLSELDFDLLTISKFNENGRLEIQDTKRQKELYEKYWKKLKQRILKDVE